VKNRARSSIGRQLAERVVPLGATLLVLAGSGACAVAGQAHPAALGPEAGYAWVIFGADTVVAEVAGSGSDRSRGLQNREAVPAGTGMLFTFDSFEKRTFWMKDTLVDLDLAVLSEDGAILEILTMQAQSLELHDTEYVVFMALEVAAGWFAGQGIGVGAQAVLVEGGPPER
jgi:uncharacterized membrane protein (UPF0127 family)